MDEENQTTKEWWTIQGSPNDVKASDNNGTSGLVEQIRERGNLYDPTKIIVSDVELYLRGLLTPLRQPRNQHEVSAQILRNRLNEAEEQLQQEAKIEIAKAQIKKKEEEEELIHEKTIINSGEVAVYQFKFQGRDSYSGYTGWREMLLYKYPTGNCQISSLSYVCNVIDLPSPEAEEEFIKKLTRRSNAQLTIDIKKEKDKKIQPFIEKYFSINFRNEYVNSNGNPMVYYLIRFKY